MKYFFVLPEFSLKYRTRRALSNERPAQGAIKTGTHPMVWSKAAEHSRTRRPLGIGMGSGCREASWECGCPPLSPRRSSGARQLSAHRPACSAHKSFELATEASDGENGGRRGALSSVVEHFLHTEGVAGSKPAARTIFSERKYSVFSVQNLVFLRASGWSGARVFPLLNTEN